MAHIYNSQLDAFSLYHKVREEEEQASESQFALSSLTPALPALGEALSGATGTALSHLLIYPLDLVITRLQVQQRQQQHDHNALDKNSHKDQTNEQYYANILDAFRSIYENEGGITAFYTGVVEDTAKSIADSFLFFLAYTLIRRTRQRQRRGALPIVDELAVGMAAGAFAKLLTTPVQNIVTRKQTAAINTQRQGKSQKEQEEKLETQTTKPVYSSVLHHTKAPTVSQIARTILREKGPLGFWSGYSATLILTLNPALTFLLHSLLSRLLLLRHRNSSLTTTNTVTPQKAAAALGPKLTFLVAALSKAIASAVTYPIGLAKARAQAGSSSSSSSAAASAREPTFSAPYASYEGWHERSEHGKVVLPVPWVLQAVVGIARAEGVGAVYAGLGGEVVKGFLGHGLTMLLKQRVHGGVVGLWGWLARMVEVLQRKG
ncbi:MAG: hypothetical protein M1821_003031 [Bathelium mastoideum]|nr:MAG: hypothetical protein M1821_003031 [Bathelium mastoideum]